MRKIALLALLGLVGCTSDQTVTPEHYSKAIEICASHGGLNHVKTADINKRHRPLVYSATGVCNNDGFKFDIEWAVKTDDK